MGRFSFHPSIHPSAPPLGHPASPEAQPARLEAQPDRSGAKSARPQASDMGQSPVEWGIFPTSVCPYIHPPLRAIQLVLRPSQPGLRPSQTAKPQARWPRGGDGRMDRRTKEHSENLPILQDFVPYRGRCPKKRSDTQKQERHLTRKTGSTPSNKKGMALSNKNIKDT